MNITTISISLFVILSIMIITVIGFIYDTWATCGSQYAPQLPPHTWLCVVSVELRSDAVQDYSLLRKVLI